LVHGKTNPGPVSIIALADLRPAAANNKLYRPIDPSDSDFQALVKSIRERGLMEPIVITTDRVIISGHRRYAACKKAGLVAVHCRVDPILSTDPKFPARLREYNRQRVKTHAEVLREEVVSADPEASHQALLAHRQKASGVDIETIEIKGSKQRAHISDAKTPFLDACIAVLNERRRYWPLSVLRQHKTTPRTVSTTTWLRSPARCAREEYGDY
jgi:hypothetical protein